MTGSPCRFPAVVLLLLSLAAGCTEKLDRLIAADGSVIAGRLSTVQGGIVAFADANPVEIGLETATVFFREGGSQSGAVSVAEGMLTLSGGSPIPLDDVEMVVWSDPSYDRSVTIEVPARDGWVASGLELLPGDMLSVSATGTVTMETGTCGPAGLDKYSTTTALFPGATHGQLVLAVGESTPVAAGSLWTGASPDSGQLLLAVNLPEDLPTSRTGGVFTVTAVRSAGPAEGSWVLYPVVR